MTAGLGHAPGRQACFPKQLNRQARTGFCSALVMGSLLLDREGSQNVTLVLALHTMPLGLAGSTTRIVHPPNDR